MSSRSAVNSTNTTAIVVIPTPVPEITIDKRDANTLAIDTDGAIGNDSQTVNLGEDARFRIMVTNTGTDDLTDVVLTDAQAAACATNA